MRVGILALLHESTTFISQPTHLEHFEQSWLFEGDQVRTHSESSHHEVGGFFEGLEGLLSRHGMLVPLDKGSYFLFKQEGSFSF